MRCAAARKISSAADGKNKRGILFPKENTPFRHEGAPVRGSRLRQDGLPEDVTQINPHRSGTQGALNMVESKIYIGLNDLSTNTQLFENEKYIRVLRNVCYSYKVPFSFQVQEGGYIYESGEYARETSLVLTLIDVDKAVVKDIAKDLCAFFHQESVLVTESHLQAHFVRETLECGGEETL
ncbi:MAG: hypothetical protein ACLRX4_15140 [Oscillospiraceae bacterium]